MSTSINNIQQIIAFAAIPIILILTSTLAIWFGAINTQPELLPSHTNLPDFDFSGSPQGVVPLSDPAPIPITRTNIFGSTIPVPKEEETSPEVMELALGLIVIKGENHFCLTNGTMLAEGDTGKGFLVHRIEENRVIYKIGETLLTLKPGDRKNVDTRGIVQTIHQNELPTINHTRNQNEPQVAE